ncbi:MAG: alcohol dehydrogenase catalytic domain-containing protein [Nitrososphaerota archaeon]|nr:alcohol dehydrogenase catalytic domain-containing protein [Nitrososphaerota archaeon]
MNDTRSVRAAFVRQGGGVELRLVPRPAQEKGSIAVRMKASGICGTDLEKLTGKNITSSVLGHEVSGVVVESGSEKFSMGDRIVPHHHVACGKCDLCTAGAGTMCKGFWESNFVPGGFADEFLVPEYNVSHGGVHKISNRLSFEEASFAEPLGCCLRGLKRVTVGRNALRSVLVVGAGPIGLLHMELLRSYFPEVKIVAVDVLKARLDFAEKMEHAETLDASKVAQGSFSVESLRYAPSGFDLAIVATGNPSAFGEAIRSVRKSGLVLLFGAPHKGSTYSLDLANFFLSEISIASSYSTTEDELAESIELLESGRIKVKKFITATYPLEKVEEAMASARSETQVKVIVTN